MTEADLSGLRALIAGYRALGRAARAESRVIPMVATLQRHLKTGVLIIDTRGSVLAARPARNAIDPAAVLAAWSDPEQPDGLRVAPIELDGDVVALIAAQGEDAICELLEFVAHIVAGELATHATTVRARDAAAAAVVRDVVHGHGPESDQAKRLDAIGLDVTSPIRVLVGHLTSGSERLANLPWNLQALTAGDLNTPRRMLIDGDVVTMVHDAATVEQRAQFMLERLRTIDRRASVGISAAYQGVPGLRIAYIEAQRAALNGSGLQHATTLDLMTIVLLHQAGPEIHAAASELLLPLHEYDQEQNGQLVATLREWLAQDRSTTATADALFIHPNTLRYRLKQAEDLLGTALEASDTLANLNLALRILHRP